MGLVIETRPDWITPEEVRHLRKLGVTKVQIGVQSLDDEILALNKRGHDVAAVRDALGLLRTAGFKLHLHWMPNLFGATPEKDRADFARFFDDPAIRPDELKIYPCSLIADTELYDRWLAGEYHPYTQEELVDLLVDVKPTIPPYTRVNRLFRDIPAHHIQAGVKVSNLREVVQRELAERGRAAAAASAVGRSNGARFSAEELVFQSLQLRDRSDPRTFSRICHRPGFGRAGLDRRLPAAEPAAAGGRRQPCLHRRDRRQRHDPRGACLWAGAVAGSGAGRRTARPSMSAWAPSCSTRRARISREAGFTRISVIAATGTRAYYAGAWV